LAVINGFFLSSLLPFFSLLIVFAPKRGAEIALNPPYT
jgi:hypothetical protein